MSSSTDKERLALGQEPTLPPEPTSPPSPSKHPFKHCLETYNQCVQEAGSEWKPQQACFLGFYKCQNKYTAECRKIYKNNGCYQALGRDECMKKLRACYGSS
ncbi:hypothetical protein ABFA07_004835 [Porites harrisoni]